MIKFSPYIRQQTGAVALLTTIIISVLIALLLLAFMTLMISEQRQQTDDQTAAQAYYIAESGVEQVLLQLLAYPTAAIPTGCMPVSFPTYNTGKITCALVSKSGQPTGSLSQPDTAVQIDSGSGYDSVVFEWDTTGGHPGFYYSYPNSCGVTSCPSPYPYAAPLESAIAEYPTTAFAAGTSQVQLKNVLFAPSTSGTGVAAFGSLGVAGNGGNPVNAQCNAAAATYHCRARVTGLSTGKNYLFRVRSRFIGTNYRMTFYNGGTQVDVPDGTATIDVTAANGSATRRVLYKVPLTKSAASGLDYVMFSDNTINKDFCIVGTTRTTLGCN